MPRRCPETGAHVPEKHEYCPHCGTPTQEHPEAEAATNRPGADDSAPDVGADDGAVLAILVFIGIAAGVYFLNKGGSTVETTEATSEAEITETAVRYATKHAQVRSGPGAGQETLGQVGRREIVRIAPDSSTEGWAARYDPDLGRVTGYVRRESLSGRMPERKDWVRVTRSGFDGDWPFTVAAGEVGCKVDEEPNFQGGTQRVDVPLFRTGGTTYALTGHGQGLGYADFRPIWRDSPGPAPKVSVSDVRRRAERLCR